MKISTKRLKEIIQEELANDVDKDVLILLEYGSQVLEALQPIKDLYEGAKDIGTEEQTEKNMIEVFTNIVRAWRSERGDPRVLKFYDENPEV
tara:strand:+ start:40 stop:315 length:276 start_codon:yes stop_codon:yes gene_type:complete